jgi:hypothetical protein
VANRDGQQTGNLAKANGAKPKRKRPPDGKSTPPKPENRLQAVARWWKTINRWWKAAGVAVSALVAAYSAWPHFSITRETVVGKNPLTASFRFTNEGWIPARNVVVLCGAGEKGFSVTAPNGGKVSFSNLSIGSPIPGWVKGHTPINRSCAISAEGSVPHGGIHVGVDYQGPFAWFTQHDEAYFTFRYDSSAGGYVFVPDIPPP